ncbi:ABC transporter permease [Yoonia sediminilitoris]|uniref:Putative ABC transport system permease protein n=1 Tax=Yoonia sediminilitoris TaxID=1286148 RepID=A0A2T6KIV1_9RHOB|nr:FtsX-like permease family protein [Yoonia sediminilitoris]PUB15647.1 putative ABC transport system permease protein [Yoonia sediminilitoris]RCW96256.1 putative ABC transport system permease protein [Yoonia sediminilitoris]
MPALDRKFLRDFIHLWKQALAIALVLACGVAILLTGMGMYKALSDTRSTYYERNRFADVFSAVRRAPDRLIAELAAIEGVWAVETRTVGETVLDLPGVAVSVTGRILSLPSDGPPLLNVPILKSGRYPDPESTSEVLVNANFAIANGFRPGDSFYANLNGQKRELTITGTVQSPEFIYTIGPGAIMPNNATFGIIWMPERAVDAAFDMAGAFNDVTLQVTAGAQTANVIDAVDRLLDPYGGLGAYGRALHPSDGFIDAEINQLRIMASILPPIFFGISAFLVSMVMGRIIALQRSQIGLLKAVGYSNLEICLHYLMLAAMIAVLGVAIGWLVGSWLARELALEYALYFDFPFLIFTMSPWVYAASGLAALVTTSLGATQAVIKSARLAPAIAMQPPAPAQFKRSVIDRAMVAMRLSQPTIMILRSLLRWPVRSALTILGLALAVSTVVAPSFFNDALDKIVDSAFYDTNRQDAMLVLSHDMPLGVVDTAADLPAVLQAEGQQFHSVILRNGFHEKRTMIEARQPDTDLSRVIGMDGQQINAPPGGVVLSRRLAADLHVGVGDSVTAKFLGGRQESHELRVTGIIEQYFGLGAFMDLDDVNVLLRQSTRVSVVNVSLDDSQVPQMHAALKDIPNLVGVVMMTDSRRSFSETIEQTIGLMNTVYLVIALLITIGVTYNGARILLSERARELASLRILGFTRAEVSYILIGETMLLALLAQPLGWLIGAQIATAMATGFSSDLYNMPVVLRPAIFAKASLVVLLASFGSVMLVRRRLDRQDLVSVMKVRE